MNRGEATVTVRTAGAEVRRFEVSPMRELLGVLADPNIAYILLGLGWLGLLFELMPPGRHLPGVVGAVCLILGFYGMSVLPVNYAGMGLIFLAIVFFILEIKVTSYGMLTVAGIVCAGAGLADAVQDARAGLAGERGIDRRALGILPSGGRFPRVAGHAGPPRRRCARASRGWSTRSAIARSPLEPPRQGVRPRGALGRGGRGAGGDWGARGGGGRPQSHPGGTPPGFVGCSY